MQTTFDLTHQHRLTKCHTIDTFFACQLGRRFRGDFLHGNFGTSFRARVSDINSDPEAKITIYNKVHRGRRGEEYSEYWAELRLDLPLFGGGRG